MAVTSGLEDDEGDDVLAEDRVRGTHHGDLLDGFVLHQRMLDVGGVHVVAAPDDDVLRSADDVEVAVAVELAEITRDQPAVAPGLRRGFGVVVVLALAAGHLEADLSDLSGRQRVAVVADDLDHGRRSDLTDGARDA